MQFAKNSLGAVAVLGALFLSPLALAQNSGSAPSAQDTAFVAKASAGGMTEIQASNFAQSNSQSASIKSFASNMVSDHTKAGDQLAAIAQKDGFTPSSAPMAGQQKSLAKLKALNGMAFDKSYSSMMLKDHVATVALFKKEVASGTNPDLKSFASQTLPTLEQHLAMAKKLGMMSQ